VSAVMRIILLWFLALPVLADTVVLQNGDHLSGKLDSIAGGHLLLQTDYAGAVPIALRAVAELQTEESYDVHAAGQRQHGRFAVLDGKQVLVMQDGTAAIEVRGVKLASQNRLALTRLVPEWSSRADLAAKYEKGNADTEQYSVLIESGVKSQTSQHSVSLRLTNEAAEQETTKDEVDIDYLYKRFIGSQWYASGNGEYFADPLKEVDTRITVGAGVGYQFWDDSFGSLSTDFGLSYVREQLDDETQSNPAIRWGLQYKRLYFAKRLEFFHRQSILLIPDAGRGEVLQASSGLRYDLSSRISATARMDLNHDTDPAPDTSKTDITYNLGVGIKF